MERDYMGSDYMEKNYMGRNYTERDYIRRDYIEAGLHYMMEELYEKETIEGRNYTRKRLHKEETT